MKKLTRLLAMALAVMMLAGCSLVTVNEDKIIVATVGDEKITKAEFNEALDELLAQYGYTQDSEDIADQLQTVKENYINQLVENKVLEQKIKELGLDQVTDEEKAAAEQEIQDWYDEQYAALVENYQSDDSVEDPEAEAAETIENYLSQYGVTLDSMKESNVASISTNKLYEYVTQDVTVTEDEAKTSYDEKVAEAKEEYDADLSAFISDYENGSTIYYKPAGCFYVKHILIALTDEQKEDISNLRADDDEAVVATADAKREEYLLTIRTKADEVLKLVDEGGDFDALIAEYGEDPGMQNDAYKDGYLTYAGDTTFVTEFAEACEGLTEDGMTTGLVASDYGYHIIRRVSTLESGEVPFEEVKDALMASLLSDKKSTTYDEQVEAWVSEANVVINTDKL